MASLKQKTRPQGNNVHLEEKLKIIYNKLDFDGKGYVARKDFVTWAENVTKIAGVSMTERIKKAWVDAYDTYIGSATNFTEWKAHVQYKLMRDDGLLKTQLKINMPLFEAVDVNGKGYIGWDEYKAFVMAVDATEAEAHVGFGYIDTNGDGVISYEEFSRGYTMYHTEKADSKYKHFWGEFQSSDTFLVEKLERFYGKLDLQRKGSVTKDDCTMWMKKTMEMIGSEANDEKERVWADWFDSFFGNSKSFDEWKAHWLSIAKNSKAVRDIAKKSSIQLFKTLGTNGSISWNEYKAFVMPLGAKEGEAHKGFGEIDLDSNGEISLNEFSRAFIEYFTVRTDSASKHFFGTYHPSYDFLNEKLKRYYRTVDFDDKGYVDKNDHMTWGKRCAEISGLEFTDELKDLIASVYDKFWAGPRNFVEFKNHMMAIFATPTPVSDYVNSDIIDMCRIIDVAQSGYITWNEYKAYVMAIGTSEADSHVAFGMIDTSHDGLLSYEEIITAITRYFVDFHDTRYKHAFGRWKENDKQ